MSSTLRMITEAFAAYRAVRGRVSSAALGLQEAQ